MRQVSRHLNVSLELWDYVDATENRNGPVPNYAGLAAQR